MARRVLLTFICGLGLFVALGARLSWLTPPEGLSPAGLTTMGVVIIMAALWILDGIPFAATALLPLIAFPILDVQAGKVVAKAYASSTIFLLMGGFFLAKGLESWRVPDHISHVVEKRAAGSPLRLLLGLALTTAFLSMWLSNTATTLIMITVAAAAISRAEDAENDIKEVGRYKLALFLSIAYAANIGGLMTPVGTAPNMLFLGFLPKLMDNPPTISFAEWMILTIPVALPLLAGMLFLLTKVLLPFSEDLDLGPQDKIKLPPLSRGARRAVGIFLVTAALWVWRSDIDTGLFMIPGWSSILGLKGIVDDGTVAMLGSFLMFALPAGEGDTPITGKRILSWDDASTIPWNLLLLFGGGLALADAFKSTGLSPWLGDQLVWLAGSPTFIIVLVLCLGMSLLTEVTSNTATTTLLLPVLFAAGGALAIDPILLMWPATLCASAAFILPISTPPNAIAAGAGDIKPLQMAKVGLPVNLLAVLLVTCFTLWWLAPRLGLQ